jgi:hypothetical protein
MSIFCKHGYLKEDTVRALRASIVAVARRSLRREKQVWRRRRHVHLARRSRRPVVVHHVDDELGLLLRSFLVVGVRVGGRAIVPKFYRLRSVLRLEK